MSEDNQGPFGTPTVALKSKGATLKFKMGPPARLMCHRGAISWHKICTTPLERLLRLPSTRMVGSIDMVLGDKWSKVLSPREREVALLVARGLTNKQVAGELRVTEGTVKIHVHNILRKLGAKSRYSLVVQRGAA